jgi:hypothetical protein
MAWKPRFENGAPRSLTKYEGRFSARFFAEIACENVGTTIGFPDLVMREGRQMYGARPCERIVPVRGARLDCDYGSDRAKT